MWGVKLGVCDDSESIWSICFALKIFILPRAPYLNHQSMPWATSGLNLVLLDWFAQDIPIPPQTIMDISILSCHRYHFYKQFYNDSLNHNKRKRKKETEKKRKWSTVTPILPLWIPMRSLSCWSGRWRVLNVLTASSSARAMRAISLPWSLPFLTGRPDTTIYASPMVLIF